MNEKKETYEEYIKRMTQTEELFKPTGWISTQNYKYRNKRMVFLKCFTGCIYNADQPIAKFWMRPEEAIHLAWLLLQSSQIWNDKRERIKEDKNVANDL